MDKISSDTKVANKVSGYLLGLNVTKTYIAIRAHSSAMISKKSVFLNLEKYETFGKDTHQKYSPKRHLSEKFMLIF